MTPSVHRRRLRFRFQLRTVLGLAVVWMVLWGNGSLVDLLVGVAVGWLITVLFPLPPIHYHGRLRPWGLLRLLGAVLVDLAQASWTLAVAAFTPHLRARPAVVKVQLRTRSDLFQVQTAEMVSIVPGSIVIDARRTARTLYLHVFDTSGPDGVEAARAEALQAERLIMQAFGSDEDLARLKEERR